MHTMRGTVFCKKKQGPHPEQQEYETLLCCVSKIGEVDSSGGLELTLLD